jgi:predicted CXXCH cytochrome family protein
MRTVYLLSLFLPIFSLVMLIDLGDAASLSSSPVEMVEEKLCTDCHSDLIESTMIHEPASKSCNDCHKVDIIKHTENGERGLNLVSELPQLCLKCHESVKTEMDSLKIQHLAMKSERSCVSCHSPHSSEEKHLLQNNQKKVCLSCHDKDKNDKGDKVSNIKKLLLTSKVVHPPVENGGCSVCHKPHGSEYNYLLINAYPKSLYATASWDSFAFCWECHDSDLLEAPTTTTATNFRDGDKNLHVLHMNEKKGRNCKICHNVHASMNEHLIEDKVVFGDWELPIRFKPLENGGSCFPGCHAEKKYTR